jgi:hypothetical protein
LAALSGMHKGRDALMVCQLWLGTMAQQQAHDVGMRCAAISQNDGF